MKKGFTLVETLAIILILGIILSISFFAINKTVENSRREAFKVSVKNAINSVDYYLTSNNIDVSSTEIISVKDLELKNVEQFTSGIIRISGDEYEAVMVTNGRYCASGTNQNLTIVKECYELDMTEPLLNESKIVIVVKSNSITILVPNESITEEESSIKNYTYELENKELNFNEKVTSENNSYQFINLKNETTYTFKLTVTNTNDKSTTKIFDVTTSFINPPTYMVNKNGYATNKTVTITYPQSEQDYIYSYSIDNGENWVTVNDTTASYTFNSNGTIIARVYDGTNYKTASSYTVSGIDLIPPSIPIISSDDYIAGQWTNKNVTLNFLATDLESGIQKYQYTLDNGVTWVNCQNSLLINWDGIHNLAIRAIDNVGNISEISEVYKIFRDTQVPLVFINPNVINTNKGTTYNMLSGVTATDNASGVSSIVSSITNTNLLNAGVYTVTYTVTDNAGNIANSTRTLNVYVTWYRSRDKTPATYYNNYSASSSTSYYCPSGYTSSGSGSSMTCSQIVTASPITTSGNAYCSEPTYSISGSYCVRTVSCTGCSGQGAACMNEKCGSGGYENNSWTCGTSSCTATMLIRYTCPSGYTNNSIYASTCYACPSGYTSSGTGSSTTCSKVVTTTRLSNTTYSCPSGGTLSGTTCIRDYYSCSTGTLSGTNCYGTWSSWTKTVLIPSATLEVETELRLIE